MLASARMEQAAVLQRETREKIYGISEKQGYQKPSYFIQLFKKTFGMVPQEYRNRTQ
ncbi:helix-turn-helix domain-containing protein [Cohnella zeiphila]